MVESGKSPSRPVEDSDPTRTRRRVLAWTGLVVALGWAVTQALLPNGILSLDIALLFLNGLAVAIYGPMLWIARTPQSPWSGVSVLGGLGISHFLWLLPASALVQFAFLPGSVRAGNACMYLATGCVLGSAVLALCRTWRVVPWLVVGTGASAALEVWGGARASLVWRPHELGLPCLPLHLGIAGALFSQAMRCIDPAPHPARRCKHCEYDLTGLLNGPCPECGKPIP